MELIEGVGESSSPPRSFRSNNYDLKTDVYNRLVETGNEDVVGNPEFRDQLSAHFNRLPASYLLDVNMDRVEVLVEHMKLLELAKDPVNRPSFHVRFLETKVDGDEDQLHSSPSSSKTSLDADSCHAESNSRQVVSCHIHEVIFSTVHKPKLLSQLSALLSDIGLNIREAHVFSTTDGYSLDVFVVDGWEGSWNGSSHSQALAAEMKPRSWEIDRRLLKMGEKIASGSCGDLYHGVYLGQDVAIKILRDEHLNEASEGEFAREVSIIREVQHKNVVRFIGACTWSPSCIVTEFMHGGSLFNYLHKLKRILKLSRVLKFAVDVCKGMEYLRQNNIIHRDLRTPNLLMDTNKVVKVAGFDVARFLNQEGVMTAEIGSYLCMAPEVMNYVPYGQKADIFSFAIVLWELITAKVPYDNMTPLQVAQGVRQGLRPELPEDMHPKLLDIMQRCWDNDPCSRPPFSALQLELAELLEELKANMAHKVRIRAMLEALYHVNKELEKAPDVSDINIRDLQNSWALVIKTSQHGIHDPDLETAFSELCTCLTDSLDWVDFCIKQDMTTMGHRRILTLYKWMKQIYDLNEGFGIYFTDLSSGKERISWTRLTKLKKTIISHHHQMEVKRRGIVTQVYHMVQVLLVVILGPLQVA